MEFPLVVPLELEEDDDELVDTDVDVEPATDPVPATLYDVPWPESGVQTPVPPRAAVKD